MRPAPSPAAPRAPALPAALALGHAVDAILCPLLSLLGTYLPTLGRFVEPVFFRIQRANSRLLRFLARAAAGRLPAPRPPRPARPARKGGRPPAYIPRRRGWLIHRTGWRIACHASQLQAELDSPRTQALLAALPPHAHATLARHLGTICRLLDITPPEPLRPPPAPPKPPQPRKPRAQRPRPVAPEHRPGWERPYPHYATPPAKKSA